MQSNEQLIDEAARLIEGAERVLFVTGAGISADSGLPTYRGIGGLYHDNLTDDGISIETALSGKMLRDHPAVTWKYLAEIETNCRNAQPNEAHRMLAALAQKRAGISVLTQNIDGLHRTAGSRHVIEIHGNLHHLVCMSCKYSWEVENFQGMSLPPVCPACGKMARPAVVLFGEMLPDSATSALTTILEQGVDLVVSVGTSSVFPYIAGPVVWAHERGKPTIEINPSETEVSPWVSLPLRMRAIEALPAIWQRLNQ